MTTPLLTEVIDGRMISTERRIGPTTDEPVRAIDVLGDHAAVFRFSISDHGNWFVNCTMARRSPSGSWEENGGGGTHGADWSIPWEQGDDFEESSPILVLGYNVRNVSIVEDEMTFVRAVYGFAAPQVRSLRVRSDRRDRIVSLESPSGAFVAMALGEGAITLQGLDLQGRQLGVAAEVREIALPSHRRSWVKRPERTGD